MIRLTKAAKLEKPTALQNYLLGKNYVVLTTSIPVGDIVEYGLDWVVDILGEFNIALGEAFADLVIYIESNYITLGDYYDLKFQHDKEIVARGYMTWGDYFDDKFEHDKAILDLVSESTGSIKADVVKLENILDVHADLLVELAQRDEDADYTFNFALVNLGGRVSNLETDVGTHKNIFQQIAMFVEDPVRWGYELVDEIITRYF